MLQLAKRSADLRIDHQTLGIALLVLGLLLLTCMDSVVKLMTDDLSSAELVWLRYATHLILFSVLWRVWRDSSPFRTRRTGMQILRGFALLGMTSGSFAALAHLQLAEVNAIMFAAPLIVTALAGPVLGEHVGARRWAAVVVGFIGVLTITRPGTEAMHFGALFAVGGCMSYAAYSLLTRKMSATESPESLLMISALVILVVLAPFGAGVIPDLSPTQWFFAFLLGILGGSGHFALIVAHRLTSAPSLAPFMYTQMIWMVLAGWMFFREIPDPWTLIGAAMVGLAGLYVIRVARPTLTPQPANASD
jgi:drug/metabolite transporter (DMT)-like permease